MTQISLLVGLVRQMCCVRRAEPCMTVTKI